eukprot:gene41414-50532_t
MVARAFLSTKSTELSNKLSLSSPRENTLRPFSNSKLNSLTKSIFDKVDSSRNVGGAGGSSTFEGLLSIDKAWTTLKNGGWAVEPKQIVFDHQETLQIPNSSSHYDVAVCGGTLGIFYALALQLRGYKAVVIERNRIQGREQEWNISKKEMLALVRMGILSVQDLEEEVAAIEFNSVRAGFKTDTSPNAADKGFEVYVRDILNLGIKPDKLIALVKDKFVSLGGVCVEEASISR